MNKKIKTTMIVAALALAGGGTWKAYDYSESHKQSLTASNIEALSSDASLDFEALAISPQVLELVWTYGRIIFDLLATGMTIAEIIEYLSPSEHLAWVPSGPTRTVRTTDPQGNQIETTQYLHNCQTVTGKGKDACAVTDLPKWI